MNESLDINLEDRIKSVASIELKDIFPTQEYVDEELLWWRNTLLNVFSHYSDKVHCSDAVAAISFGIPVGAINEFSSGFSCVQVLYSRMVMSCMNAFLGPVFGAYQDKIRYGNWVDDEMYRHKFGDTARDDNSSEMNALFSGFAQPIWELADGKTTIRNAMVSSYESFKTYFSTDNRVDKLRFAAKRYISDTVAGSLFWNTIYVPLCLLRGVEIEKIVSASVGVFIISATLGGPYGLYQDWVRKKMGVVNGKHSV